jgi:hypothetical protein
MGYKVVKDSFKQLGDGSATVIVSCPVITCHEQFKISYKSYNSCYKPKKKIAESQRLIPPRWYLSPMQNHFKLHHSSSPSCLPRQTEETLADLTWESSTQSVSAQENETAIDFTNETSSTAHSLKTNDQNRVISVQNHSVPVAQPKSLTLRPRRKRTLLAQKNIFTKRTKM